MPLMQNTVSGKFSLEVKINRKTSGEEIRVGSLFL